MKTKSSTPAARMRTFAVQMICLLALATYLGGTRVEARAVLLTKNFEPGSAAAFAKVLTSDIDTVILDPYATTLDGGTTLIPTLGNHDIKSGKSDQILADLGAPGRWYTMEFSDTLIVVLDSTRFGDIEQRDWLETVLSTTESRWVIVAMHHPPYSAGRHGSDVSVRNAFSDLFATYGVDLVMTGHDHDYQRSTPIDGVTYVVSGGGSEVRKHGEAPFMVITRSELHFVDVEVAFDHLMVTAIGLNGVIDRFTLLKE